MYLLDATTFTLHSFSQPNIPAYAILSHRWDAVEVSFDDIKNNSDVQQHPSFPKIRGCCAQARLDDWKYVWIDSCRIDKSSSAELSEAINSMFLWYSEAHACYTYLNDVFEDETTSDLSNAGLEAAFRESQWFRRGWTLQELLAPEFVTFFTRDWKEIGTKRSLRRTLSSITGIRSDVLEGYATTSSASIAERMSWASRRVTSRTEDMAYCLLGLFGVNMSPLYGEGHNAFIRLQLEIMRSTNDESIFAWITKQEDKPLGHGGLLAMSPAAFKDSGDVIRSHFDLGRPPYQMTNKGLRMELELMSVPYADGKWEAGTHVAVLNCSRRRASSFVALHLRKRYRDEFVRIKSELWLDWPRGSKVTDATKRQVIYVQQNDNTPQLEQGREYEVCASLSYTGDLNLAYDLSVFTSNKGDIPLLYQTGRVNVDVEAGTAPPVFALFHCRRTNLYRSSNTSFIVAVNLSRKPFGVDVIAPGDADLHIFPHLHSAMSYNGRVSHVDSERILRRLVRCCLDRVSHVLSSGTSVFVTFKKGYAERRKERYLVHIVIDTTEDFP